MGKQNLYEHSIRIPMILSGPGISENRTSDALIYLNDLYPTLCEIAGIGIPSSVETRSFIECIKDPAQDHREWLVFAYKHFQRAIRQGQWKYIEYQVEGDLHQQLFNLEDDPWETRNLAVFPGNRSLMIDLRNELRKNWVEMGDSGFNWDIEL
jgi:arylsulfatase A-like enzyme